MLLDSCVHKHAHSCAYIQIRKWQTNRYRQTEIQTVRWEMLRLTGTETDRHTDTEDDRNAHTDTHKKHS